MKTILACVGSWLMLSLLSWLSLRFSWLALVSTASTIAVLYVAAKAIDARGPSLFSLLALLYGGIGVVNIQFESLVFKIIPPFEILRGTATGLAQVVAVSAALAWAITRDDPRQGPFSRHRLPNRLWARLPVFALTYIVLYFVAGLLILPFIRDFYATSGMVTFPSLGAIIGAQFVRGLVYAASMILLLRRMEGRRREAALVAALCLSILGGIAPLLLPVDDVFPFEVRRFHIMEIVGSNSLLGVIAALLLVRRTPSVRSEGAVATA